MVFGCGISGSKAEVIKGLLCWLVVVKGRRGGEVVGYICVGVVEGLRVCVAIEWGLRVWVDLRSRGP
jgi:hypothetical protein